MSFYSGNRQGNLPGPIVNNPLNGLCERAVIQVKKVFDACLKQVQENDVQIAVTNFSPASPTYPITFVSCQSDVGTQLLNVEVDRFDDKPCFARVKADVVIPIIIQYVDAEGNAGRACGSITFNNDVILYVPQASIVPYQIEGFGSAICADGEYIGNNTFSVDLCITVILKVVVEADILVPTYGYATIPPCQEYTQDVCGDFFDLPLFPAIRPVQSNCPTGQQ